jgi:hypothetical protein
MTPEDRDLSRRLLWTVQTGIGAGGFILSIFAPGPLFVKLGILGLIVEAALLVTAWHFGHKSGARQRRPSQ